jgi:tetratricopeptide (TPR) repeat protein
MTLEESKKGMVIKNCLQAVDEAQPWFICILGDRYGWSLDTDPDSVLLKQTFQIAEKDYPWLKNYRDRSVTEIEILHGFLNKTPKERKEINFLLYIRQAKEEGEVKAVECDSARTKLEDLTKRCTAMAPFGAHYYTTAEQLGELVLKDIQELIERDFPLVKEKDKSPEDREEEAHLSYSRVASTAHAPVMANDTMLDKYLTADNEANRAGSGAIRSDEDTSGKSLVLFGKPGCGKSALVSHYFLRRVVTQALQTENRRQSGSQARRESIKNPRSQTSRYLESTDVLVLHHVGSSPTSCKLENIILRFMGRCRALIGDSFRYFGTDGAGDMPSDRRAIIAVLPDFIKYAAGVAGAVGKRLVWIIDGLEQIERSSNWLSESDMSWCPKPPLPANFSFICTVSTPHAGGGQGATVGVESLEEMDKATTMVPLDDLDGGSVGRRRSSSSSDSDSENGFGGQGAGSRKKTENLVHLEQQTQESKRRLSRVSARSSYTRQLTVYMSDRPEQWVMRRVHLLSREETEEVIHAFLRLHHHKLTTAQLDKFTAATTTRVPGFLATVCKLLLQFGNFQELDSQLDKCLSATSMPGLIRFAVSRFGAADAKFALRMLAFIVCTRAGLSREELLELMQLDSSLSGLVPLSQFQFAGIFRTVQPWLHVDSNGYHSLANESSREAVLEIFRELCVDSSDGDAYAGRRNSSSEDEAEWDKLLAPLHMTLAMFFDTKVNRTSYRCVEFVYHRFRAAIIHNKRRNRQNGNQEHGVGVGGSSATQADKMLPTSHGQRLAVHQRRRSQARTTASESINPEQIEDQTMEIAMTALMLDVDGDITKSRIVRQADSSFGEEGLNMEQLADVSLIPHILGPHFVDTFKQLCQQLAATTPIEEYQMRAQSGNIIFAAFIRTCDSTPELQDERKPSGAAIERSTSANASNDENMRWKLRLLIADFGRDVGEYSLAGRLLERIVNWTMHRRRPRRSEILDEQGSRRGSNDEQDEPPSQFAVDNHMLCCTKLAELYSRHSVQPLLSNDASGSEDSGTAVGSAMREARRALHVYPGMDRTEAAEMLLTHALDEIITDDALMSTLGEHAASAAGVGAAVDARQDSPTPGRSFRRMETSAVGIAATVVAVRDDTAAHRSDAAMLPQIYQSLGWIKINGRSALMKAVTLAEKQETDAEALKAVAAAFKTVEYADREALVCFRSALLALKEQGDWVGVAHALNGLGTVRQKQRRFDQAERLFTQCLEIRRQHLYATHPDIAQVLTSTGSLLCDIGEKRFIEAEALFKEALKVYTASLGREHPRLQHAKKGLKEVQQALGASGAQR